MLRRTMHQMKVTGTICTVTKGKLQPCLPQKPVAAIMQYCSAVWISYTDMYTKFYHQQRCPEACCISHAHNSLPCRCVLMRGHGKHCNTNFMPRMHIMQAESKPCQIQQRRCSSHCTSCFRSTSCISSAAPSAEEPCST